MEGLASEDMLAQQLSVLVQCHACQATLQVTLPEEVRLHCPPVLKIRCNSCASNLEVSMPPSAYDINTQAAARAALAMQQAVQARAQVAQARQQQLLMHTYQQGLAAATGSAAGVGRGASSGASLQQQLQRIEQESQQVRQVRQERQQAQQPVPPEGQGLHAPGQQYCVVPQQVQQASHTQQAQQLQHPQPPLGPIPSGGLSLQHLGEPNLSLLLSVLGSPPSPLPTGLDRPPSPAQLPSCSAPANQQIEQSLEPASPDDFARLLADLDFSPLASPQGSLAFPATQPLQPALKSLQQLCHMPERQQVQQQLAVPTYPPLLPGRGTPGGNASETPQVHVEVRPRPDYEPGAAPARGSANSTGGASNGGLHPEAAGMAARAAPGARAAQQRRSSVARGAAPGAPQEQPRPLRLKLSAKRDTPGAERVGAVQVGSQAQAGAARVPASPLTTGRAGRAKAPRLLEPAAGSRAARSKAGGSGSTGAANGRGSAAAQDNGAGLPKQAAAGGNGRSGRGTKHGAPTAAQGGEGVKRTAYQHYTKAEYARLKREHPHLPRQQLFDRVIQGWQTSPMNPNRQASPEAEDSQVQPEADAGKVAAGKAAAGRGSKPAAAKAPAPKAQAAKPQRQGGRAGQAGQPQGPAAALLDAERRRAAQHSAPTPRKQTHAP